MTGRENILNAIKENKPTSNLELPALPSYSSPISKEDGLQLFTKNLTDNAAVVKMIETRDQISDLILHQWHDPSHIHAPLIPYLHNTPATPEAAATLDIALVKGNIGVINNGAIWVHDRSLEHRSVAFLPKYLVIWIETKDLVYNLHEAYAKINPFDFGYGVWISGPSKTGDIEQALVIGAHGPLEVMVLIQSN